MSCSIPSLSELETELARQDREVAAALASLHRHADGSTQLAIGTDLWSEFETAWDAAATLRPAAAPILAPRC